VTGYAINVALDADTVALVKLADLALPMSSRLMEISSTKLIHRRTGLLRLPQQLIFDGCSITGAWGWKVIVERAWAHGAARLTHGGAAAGEA